MIVSAPDGTLEAFQLSPQCPGGNGIQTSWRLSIPFQTGTDGLSYALSSYAYVGTDKVVTSSVALDCLECHNQSEYASALVTAEGCISRQECLEISIQDSDTSEGLKWVSLFQDEILEWSAIAGPTEETYNLVNQEECQILTPCPEGEEMVVLALTSDRATSKETNWFLKTRDSTVVMENDPQSLETPFYRSCVPSTPSQCLTFQILDDFGDGVCCNVGHGRYALYAGEEKVISREGSDFAYGERIQFGNGCNTEVEAAVSIALSLEADSKPGEIQWRFEDSAGVVHASSTTPLVRHTRFTLFPSDVNGCLFLYVDDDGGDGNEGYALTNDGQEIVSRDGNFRHMERTQFAAGPLSKQACPTTVVQASDIEIELFLGNDPSNLSWYLGNIDGEPLGSISVGQNEPSGKIIRISYNPIDAGNPDDCFTFTVINDGARSNDEWYSVTLGIKDIVTQRGLLGFGERLRFGNSCPSTGLDISPAVPIMVNVTFDHFPHETKWWVEDREGQKLLESDDTLYDPDYEVEMFNHFRRDEEDRCLYFYITDEGGDGICCLADNFGPRNLNEERNDGRRLQTSTTPSVSPTRSKQPSASPTLSAHPSASIAPSTAPSSEPTAVPSTSPSVSPSSSSMPSSEPSVTRVNGGFELLVNEQVVYVGSGLYASGERVRFGDGCEIQVDPLSARRH